MDVLTARPHLPLDVGAGIVEAVAIEGGAVVDAVALQASATTGVGLAACELEGVVDCTAPVPSERLEIRPPARTCIDCRRRHEAA
ncbi:TraR/DksA C4-type zinc finger protein [Nonomuraea dietziae]|uniref:TraR/DksA C4-type zinc finger protein n=1 Tax=Nonomuraea dietziae TaxID=65515 RepID=UPI0034276F0A